MASVGRVLDAPAYRQTTHVRLNIEPEGEMLDPSLA